MLTFDGDRPSDSPFVERVWRSHSVAAGWFTSIAESRGEIVVARYRDQVSVVMRGAETSATRVPYPPDTEWLGIRLKPGAGLAPQPARTLLNGKAILPALGRCSFLLNGSAWQAPDFGNADVFADWLARDGLLVMDPAVPDALHGDPPDSSPRTLQRRFLRATGVTQGMARQIEQARYATLLLTGSVAISAAVEQAGYFDQPHLTRSLRRFTGHTPAQLIDENRRERLSFLYKTRTFPRP